MFIPKTRRHKTVKKWIKDVYAKDNYECKKCGTKEKLHAHHIAGWHESPELRIDINNGLTLCSSCHQILHTTGNKLTKEHINKIVESRKWYKHSEETKAKQRANAGRPKGIPMSEEQKKSQSIRNTGRKASEETKAKLRMNAGRPKGIPTTEKRKKEVSEFFKDWHKGKSLKIDPETGKRSWCE